MSCFALAVVGGVIGILLVNWIAPWWYRTKIGELRRALDEARSRP